ncbi:hypothetical protein BDM02DRAFT_1938228 [Thelephora ganbajun]|uniref:Uncharacterized protein n=1 Tax=Thelephora ganbajun TaxID=370292 RepID=A0ACB6ZIQ4_THEGA|nr:hypothetical protein BDM02DRAFT_1938228 [Thelephora ganbajun]
MPMSPLRDKHAPSTVSPVTHDISRIQDFWPDSHRLEDLGHSVPLIRSIGDSVALAFTFMMNGIFTDGEITAPL